MILAFVVGLLTVLVLQGLGLLIIWRLGEDIEEAGEWWYSFTGWLVWLPIYLLRERRRHRTNENKIPHE